MILGKTGNKALTASLSLHHRENSPIYNVPTYICILIYYILGIRYRYDRTILGRLETSFLDLTFVIFTAPSRLTTARTDHFLKGDVPELVRSEQKSLMLALPPELAYVRPRLGHLEPCRSPFSPMLDRCLAYVEPSLDLG